MVSSLCKRAFKEFYRCYLWENPQSACLTPMPFECCALYMAVSKPKNFKETAINLKMGQQNSKMKENAQAKKLCDQSPFKQKLKHLLGLENTELTIRKHQIPGIYASKKKNRLPEGKISPKYFSTSSCDFPV